MPTNYGDRRENTSQRLFDNVWSVFVSNCTEVLNLVKFSQAVYKIGLPC